MIKPVIICFFISSPEIFISYAQDNFDDKIKTTSESREKNSIIKIKTEGSLTPEKNTEADFYNSFEVSVRISTKFILHPDRTAEKPAVDIVTSYRNNIHFGGFWNGYAILNFTPSIYLQPFDFISIYANHNISMYVPFKKIKENLKSLIIEGAAIMAVDNSIKFLLPENQISQSIAGFAVKNFVLILVQNITNKKGN